MIEAQFERRASNFIQKENPTQVFPCKFCTVFKSTCFLERLRTAAFGVILNQINDTPLLL